MPRILYAAIIPLALMASPGFAQAPTDRLTPTIPESQIEPAPLSTPFEFLSVATSANEFVIESAALETAKGGADEVKAFAARLATTHEAMRTALREAGAKDGVEVAKPAMDGEQTGLLGKLEAMDGAALDAAYIDAQIFVHQRTIAYYRGYADRQDALGDAARSQLPTLIADYAGLVALAGKYIPPEAAVQ